MLICYISSWDIVMLSFSIIRHVAKHIYWILIQEQHLDLLQKLSCQNTPEMLCCLFTIHTIGCFWFRDNYFKCTLVQSNVKSVEWKINCKICKSPKNKDPMNRISLICLCLFAFQFISNCTLNWWQFDH